MYWYKLAFKKHLVAVFCTFAGAVLLASCKPAIKEDDKPVYFDIKGYFAGEAARLTKLNKPVLKTIVHNGTAETKKVAIRNWEEELSMFAAADINKPAFKSSYTVNQTANTVIYKVKEDEEDLETREIIINREGKQIKWLLIYTRTAKNLLYRTTAKLSWFPDSAYQIQKVQTVKLLGKNVYDISGKLNQ